MPINLPETGQQRIVIVGAGFAGLKLARRIAKLDYQIVILDRNNFHQFQPLLYQVAMAGVEPSAISFPLRKMFSSYRNVYMRMCTVRHIDLDSRQLDTDLGPVNFDILVLAMGVTTNYYGNTDLAKRVYTLKSVSESLYLRNALLSDLEKAITVREYDTRQGLLDIVIVGGGPTGVELAGALAEMKRYVIPEEYGELDPNEIDIHLVEGAPRLLNTMSEVASKKAQDFLTKMGVKVQTGVFVEDFKDGYVKLSDGSSLQAFKVIWAAGIKGRKISGIPEECYGRGGRLIVDEYHALKCASDVYVLGDQAIMMKGGEEYSQPQVAQGAIQHGKSLARNFKRISKGKLPLAFEYKDLGTMATIGRNKAVADLPWIKLQGFLAWILWLVVHLRSILGVKNKLLVLINWIWNYFTYDPGLRVVIRPKVKE